MSTRWMAVQYVGDTLRIPVVNESDMGTPFGSSTLERDVRRIVVNPFSDSPQVFVPEAENENLRELCEDMMAFVEDDDACERCGHDAECVEAADGELVLPYEGRCLMLDLFANRMRELGMEVE